MKTKTVSSSKASGDSLRKRSADEIGLEVESKSKPLPSKISKLGFGMTAKKPTTISIKLGASVCLFYYVACVCVCVCVWIDRYNVILHIDKYIYIYIHRH